MPDKPKQKCEHILAYIKWYQSHSNSDFNAIVCKNTYGTNLKYCNIYMEIQRMEINTLELQPLTFYQLHFVVE